MKKQFHELKILIVDDDKTMRRIVSNYLKNVGARNVTMINVASKAYNLLEIAHEEKDPFDLVLLDINMPGKTGDQLLEEVKNHRLLGATKIIMVTAENDKETVLKCVDAGADYYLIKPVMEQALAEAIDKLNITKAVN
jgi:CheY-like chemotaxis protein